MLRASGDKLKPEDGLRIQKDVYSGFDKFLARQLAALRPRAVVREEVSRRILEHRRGVVVGPEDERATGIVDAADVSAGVVGQLITYRFVDLLFEDRTEILPYGVGAMARDVDVGLTAPAFSHAIGG